MDLRLPVCIFGKGHGAGAWCGMELYQGTSTMIPPGGGLYLGTVFLNHPALIDLCLTCWAQTGLGYSTQAGLIPFKQQARLQHDRFDNN
jgi:hypothetical protein